MLGWLKQFFKDKPNLGVNPQLPKPAALTDAERRKLEKQKDGLMDIMQPHVYKIFLNEHALDELIKWAVNTKETNNKGACLASKTPFGTHVLVYGDKADWDEHFPKIVQKFNEACEKLGEPENVEIQLETTD